MKYKTWEDLPDGSIVARRWKNNFHLIGIYSLTVKGLAYDRRGRTFHASQFDHPSGLARLTHATGNASWHIEFVPGDPHPEIDYSPTKSKYLVGMKLKVKASDLPIGTEVYSAFYKQQLKKVGPDLWHPSTTFNDYITVSSTITSLPKE